MEKKLSDIIKLLFDDKERNNYQYLSNNEKEKWGFIVNRFLSKKFPEMSQLLNIRGGDKSVILDMWWIYLKFQDRRNWYQWMWKKSKIKKEKINLKIINQFKENYPQLTDHDIEYFATWFPEEYKEEISYYKKLEEDYD